MADQLTLSNLRRILRPKFSPPHLLLVVAKTKGAEGDGYFRLPTLLGDFGLHIPDAVPVIVSCLSVSGNLAVPLGSSRVGGEYEAISIVIKGVENHGEGVIVAGSEISGEIVYNDPLRARRVEKVHSQVQVLIIVKEPYFGFLGTGLTSSRLLLSEIGGGFGQAPGRLVQDSVHDNGRFDESGGDLPVCVLGQGSLAQAAQSQGSSHQPVDSSSQEVLKSQRHRLAWR